MVAAIRLTSKKQTHIEQILIGYIKEIEIRFLKSVNEQNACIFYCCDHIEIITNV